MSAVEQTQTASNLRNSYGRGRGSDMHISELKEALRHFARRADDLANRLHEKGVELGSDEKKLCRMVEMTLIGDRMDEALWYFWRGQEQEYRKALDNIIGSADGLW
ncbi:MAG: hypothetical protein ACWGQW_04820 [bacterium]